MINIFDFKHHIFDLDDTLINTRYSYQNAQIEIIHSLFPDFSDEKKSDYINDLTWFCRTMGSGNTKLYFTAFLKNCGISGIQLQTYFKQSQEVYELNFWDKLIPLHGVFEFIRMLQDKQKTLSLVSNGKVESQAKKLKKTNLSQIFDDHNSFISEEYENNQKKPSPFMLALACKRSKTTPSESLYYGNSVSDILAGNLAGIQTVFINGDEAINFSKLPTIARPTHSIDHWTELL